MRRALDGKARRYLGIALEIVAPDDLLSYDLDHCVVPDYRYLSLLDRLADWLQKVALSKDIQALHDGARHHRDTHVADLLQTRQNQLQRRPMVLLRGKPILHEPQSENDVLALYFKLEGAGALPVESCCVLEHTPARGTDAIGHFRLGAADALNKYALIEFEYNFANFLAHGHSLRHVDFVICWSVSTGAPLRPKDPSWLMTYTDTVLDKTIPVLVLSRIPELEVKGA